jgi:alpha-ribazole phosphatase
MTKAQQGRKQLSRILLVRHGQIKLNEDNRFWGKTDVTLSDLGIKQVERLRDRLDAEKINAIYTSTLSRARLTAEIIASGHKCSITARDELNELNFGFVEGLTFEEIKDLYPELAEALGGFEAPPRFPGGESFDELDNRVQNFLKTLPKHKPEETILIVSHAGTLRLIICHLLGTGIEHWRKIRLDMASLSIIETYPQGAILSLLNDISHTRL